jgi:archaeosine-15-forming tRNA-guanine transglycosylase
VRSYGRNIEAMIESQTTEQPFTSFEMVKRIRDAKENERRYLVKTVQDGAFILSVYELA